MPAVTQHGIRRHGWVAVIARVVPVLLHGHLKRIAVIHGRVHALAVTTQVLIHAAAPQHWTRATVVDRHFARENTDAGCSLDKDCIGCQQGVVFLNDWLKLIQKRFALGQPAWREISRGTADGDVAVGETSPTRLFKEVEDLFPFAKGVEKRAECA